MKRLRRLEQSVSGTNTFSVDEYLIGTQLFKKGEHVFKRCSDPSVLVTAS